MHKTHTKITRVKHVKLYDHRTHNIDRLRYAVALYDWSYVKGATNIRPYNNVRLFSSSSVSVIA